MMDYDQEMSEQEKKLANLIGQHNGNHVPHLLKLSTDEHGAIIIMIQNMFEAIPFTVAALMAVGEFFGTDKVNIDEESHHSEGGCDSCDYGSKHYFELKVYK